MTVPAVSDVAAAVRALPSTRDPVAAIAHLATPRSCAVGLQVQVTDEYVGFRGRRVHVGGCDSGEIARRVSQLVADRGRETDTFCELTAPPATWLKPIRSGAHILLAGASELFGSQPVRVRHDAASPATLAALSSAVAGGSLRDGCGPFRVRRDPDMITVEPIASAAPATSTGACGPSQGEDVFVAAARTCSMWEMLLDAQDAQWCTQESTFEGVLSLTGTLTRGRDLLELPLLHTPVSSMPGIPSADTAPVVPTVPAPSGFSWVGVRLHDGAGVAEHAATGVRVAVNPPAVTSGV